MAANVSRPPLDNKLVRQALNYAINRQRIADTVLLGTGQPFDLPWNKGTLAYEDNKVNLYTYDLDKARSLMQHAGVSNVEMDLVGQQGLPELDQVGELYQADLTAIGIKLNLKNVDAGTWLSQVSQPKYPNTYMYISPNGYSQLPTPGSR
jgi:peptide/nickel transport system substrate-binding protein